MPDSQPTLAGLIAFGRTPAGIPTIALPDAAPDWQIALTYALEWVPCELQCITPIMYTACVYNWAISSIVQYAQDQPGQTFFADLQKAFKTDDFVAGVVSSSSDNGTAAALTIGDALSNLSFIDLQRAKDPFGRAALAIMSSIGSVWGLS